MAAQTLPDLFSSSEVGNDFLIALIFICFMYRYGKPGCDAETCDYFLSYRRIGTDVEYEMSADTDGWVAVGFSSDKKMVSSCETRHKTFLLHCPAWL